MKNIPEHEPRETLSDTPAKIHNTRAYPIKWEIESPLPNLVEETKIAKSNESQGAVKTLEDSRKSSRRDSKGPP